MGEIADALRRAREQQSSADAGRQRPAPPLEGTHASRTHPPDSTTAEGPSSVGSAAHAETQAAHLVDAPAPANNAIVLQGPAVEAFRAVAMRVRRELYERRAASVAIVSAVREEGKTTVLCNLGLALASLSGGSNNVALVDLDLRQPSIARVLGVPGDTGIEEVLRGSATLDDVRISVRHPRVDLYPAIEPQRAAHELLALPSFAAMIGELEELYSVVLFDTPPTLLVPDTSLILGHVATCIAIARSGETRARYFQQLIQTLPKHRVLGELLNATRTPRYSYGYSYGGEDGDSDPTKTDDLRSARQP